MELDLEEGFAGKSRVQTFMLIMFHQFKHFNTVKHCCRTGRPFSWQGYFCLIFLHQMPKQISCMCEKTGQHTLFWFWFWEWSSQMQWPHDDEFKVLPWSPNSPDLRSSISEITLWFKEWLSCLLWFRTTAFSQ